MSEVIILTGKSVRVVKSLQWFTIKYHQILLTMPHVVCHHLPSENVSDSIASSLTYILYTHRNLTWENSLRSFLPALVYIRLHLPRCLFIPHILGGLGDLLNAPVLSFTYLHCNRYYCTISVGMSIPPRYVTLIRCRGCISNQYIPRTWAFKCLIIFLFEGA